MYFLKPRNTTTQQTKKIFPTIATKPTTVRQKTMTQTTMTQTTMTQATMTKPTAQGPKGKKYLCVIVPNKFLVYCFSFTGQLLKNRGKQSRKF